MLRIAARFHPDERRLPVSKVLEKPLPLELQADDFSRLRVDPMQLEHSLRYIDTDTSSFM
jgi:hypothetical protein